MTRQAETEVHNKPRNGRNRVRPPGARKRQEGFFPSTFTGRVGLVTP